MATRPSFSPVAFWAALRRSLYFLESRNLRRSTGSRSAAISSRPSLSRNQSSACVPSVADDDHTWGRRCGAFRVPADKAPTRTSGTFATGRRGRSYAAPCAECAPPRARSCLASSCQNRFPLCCRPRMAGAKSNQLAGQAAARRPVPGASHPGPPPGRRESPRVVRRFRRCG